jgi:multidrug transporter EmrE-like cation transporter
MLAISPPVLVVTGILTTAVAQILLKKASSFEIKTMSWAFFVGTSAAFYVLSFLLYSQMLRHYPLNKIYPVATIAQIALITVAGLAFGEAIDVRHAVGLALGAVAVFLIFS